MPTHPSPATVPPARPDPPLRRVGSEAGFSLIEVLVSALIVILMSVGTATALIVTSHTSGDQRLRSQANSIASQDQERLRGLSDEQLSELNASNQSRTVTLNGTSFTVTSATTYLDTTGTSSCTSSAAAYFKIASTVSWTENFSRQSTSITEDSLLSRPVTGDLLATATDQTGAGLSGVTVTATGPSNQTGATDVNGCTLFAGLTPGSYTVALSDAGYVDPNGNSSPSGTATVTTTGTASTSGGTFHLGLAGSIVGTFGTSTTGAGGEADGISWLGNGASYGMSAFQPFPTAAPSVPSPGYTTGLLFPFHLTSPANYTHNYAVWGGRCGQQEPPSPTLASVAPGSTNQALAVQEPLLDLNNVSYPNSVTAVKPAHVRLTFTATSAPSCSDSWKASISSASTLPATGWLANPGQPYASSTTGTFTVCADYNNHKVSVPATNTNFGAMNVVPAIAITNSSPSGTC